MKKRCLALLLALCLAVPLLPGTARAAAIHPFTDVSGGDWYLEAVEYVFDNSLMNGTGNGKFSPDLSTSRGMLVTVLHRLAGNPEGEGLSFRDVPEGKWYSQAVAWASGNGVVDGYGQDRFGPDDPVTRQQLAAVMYRFANYMGYDITPRANLFFQDLDQVSSYALEPLSWALATGLIQGLNDNRIAPGRPATRAQVAAVLMRFQTGIAAEIQEETPVPDPLTAEQMYLPVLNQYRLAMANDYFYRDEAPEDMPGLYINWFELASPSYGSARWIWYALEDIDGNGIPELLLGCTGEGRAWRDAEPVLLDLFTYDGKKPVSPFSGAASSSRFVARDSLSVCQDGLLVNTLSSGLEESGISYYRLDEAGVRARLLERYYSEKEDPEDPTVTYYHRDADGRIRLISQEDFAQAMGRDNGERYEIRWQLLA